MKSPYPTVLSSVLAPLGLLLATTATSTAGVDITAFTTADVNVNGSLDQAEFNTTLEAGLSVRAQTRRFIAADANANGSIQLNEFLIFTGVLDFSNNLEHKFLLGDASVNGSLSFDEFVSISGRRTSMVNIRRNFLRADVDENGSVTLEEYLDFRRGQSPRVDFTIRELADFDNNGIITEAEFSNWFKQGTAEGKISIRFGRFDANLDGTLSISEWNPGVRVVL